MSQINNFKELEKEHEKMFEEKSNKIKNSLDANIGSMRVVTDVIELYFSKVLEFFVKISGGDLSNKDNDPSS